MIKLMKNLKSALNNCIIIIILALVNAAGGDVCNNDVIQCSNDTTHVYCSIYQNNTEIVSQAISLCSSGIFLEMEIHLDIGLQVNTTIITLNLANNIQSIRIYGDTSSSLKQPVYLIASQSYPNITSMNLYYVYIYNSDHLFDIFPNITNSYVQSSYFNAGLKFSKLKELTRLHIYNSGLSNITMDKEWVGGLSRLRYLRLYRCGVQNITTDAFENLKSLTYLNLAYNNILELTPGVFRDLTALKVFNIYRNNYAIRMYKDGNNYNAFNSLRKLTSISLSSTKIIPFYAFTTLNFIQSITLPQTSSVIVPSTPFQQFRKLTYLSFSGISLTCNCSMQWASIIGKFGIDIYGWCRNSGTYVTDASQYTECGLTESYQCFNKSASCNHSCINTPNSYICTACDAEYGLSESACHDINECLQNISYCEQKCRKKLGSYQCYCDFGYRLSDDFISCTEIDECSNSSLNTCEQHQCLNEMGSYRCICDPGYYLSGDGYSCHEFETCNDTNNQQLYLNGFGIYSCICKESYRLSLDGTSCEDINECNEISLNSCDHHCLNEPGSYRCTCNEGYKLALNNISCHDIDECMDSNNSCSPHECLNLVGSYTCSCGEGFNLNTNGKNCEEIDKCHNMVLDGYNKHLCINEDGFITIYANVTCNSDFTNLPSCLPLTATTHISSSTLRNIICSNQSSDSLASSISEFSFEKYILIGIVIFLVVIIFGLCCFLFSLLLIFLYKKKNKEKNCSKVYENSNTIKENKNEYIEMAANLDYPVQNKNQQDSKSHNQEVSINSIPKSKISITKQPKGDYTTSYEKLADLPNYSNAGFDFGAKDSIILYDNLRSLKN